MRIFIFIFSALFLFSCGDDNKKKKLSKKEIKVVKQKLEDVNNFLEKKASDEIDAYILKHEWKMTTTGTGLRYEIYEIGKGELASMGKFAKVNYKIYLLDGTVCYDSKQDGYKEFKVGEDYVETGIHEGVQLMHVGDKARFILPSHLAHGLMGDYNKIPPMSSIVYDIELLKIR